MSLHYIIDGYNVIKQVTFFTGKKLRAGRDSLVHFIEQHRPQGSSKNEVTVVFDGKAEFDNPQIKSATEVIFSKNETADDKIKRMVEHSRNPKRIVVVSDDKAIVFYCRSLGARIKTVKEFLNDSRIPEKVKPDFEGADKPDLSSNAAQEITEQLKDIWLKSEEE
ncbi:MAG: hypothetical protein GY853_02925 [PVC group bacterium]|nr:hypothetical protein [PVC group bacterium]